MRKVLAIAVLLTALLALTNPSKAEYVAWLEESFFAREDVEGLGRLLVSAVGMPMVEAATEARSYGVCTVFRTGERVTVGILGRFVAVE